MRSLILALIASGALAGCVVRPATVAVVRPTPVGAVAVVPAPACVGGVWQPGHHGRWGRWHPGHWRCPGGRIIVVP